MAAPGVPAYLLDDAEVHDIAVLAYLRKKTITIIGSVGKRRGRSSGSNGTKT